MRLERLSVAGFRGFNLERVIDFHDKLTLIAAPNSHGKTSISEALEFLLFGATSKVEHADSKEEYRDSYRNRHYPADKPAYIEGAFTKTPTETLVLRVELDTQGNLRRFVNGRAVAAWPFADDMVNAARPFILQHALKYLLLVPPTERFQGFARLLGLNVVDALQQAIVNLCTKPEASIPVEAKRILSELGNTEDRLQGFEELKKIVRDFKKGFSGVIDAYKALESRADKLLGKKIKPAERLAHLVRTRDEITSKVYGGTVAIKVSNEGEKKQIAGFRETLSSTIDSTFLQDYAKLAARNVTERLSREAQLLDLGIKLMEEAPGSCPLCAQALNEPIRVHISQRHEDLKRKIGGIATLEDIRRRTEIALKEVRSAHERHQKLLENRCSDLLYATAAGNEQKVHELFGKENEANWEIVQSAKTAIAPLLEGLKEAGDEVEKAIALCEEAIRSRNEEVAQMETLAKSLQKYLTDTDKFDSQLNELEPSLVGPARLLQQAIDRLAGTTEMTLLIELFEKRPSVERALKIRDVLGSLKELKKHVDQTLGETMEAAIDTDLTESVMSWYGRIRTKGDPNVHFSGFAMERTKAGDFKSRRLKVKAQSYGVELASAVSSLSESKLNALGLCVSIASALRSAGPWEFLVLDDPIQSWDDEHEIQFIEIVRALVEQERKQVILLSHKGQWIKSVTLGCRSLNGLHYEITGYTQDGPHLNVLEWMSVEQRLREADTIANDPNATSVRLQQAEEEIRLAACQITTEIAKVKLNRDTSPHNMNSRDVRAILNEAGYAAPLIDRVVATFGTTDDAHHTPKHYQPNAQRIRQYLGTLRELRSS